MFGKRGGDVAAARVPGHGHGHGTEAEAVGQRRHLTRLRGHVIGRRGRGLAAARKVDPNDVMVAGQRRDHRPRGGARREGQAREQRSGDAGGGAAVPGDERLGGSGRGAQGRRVADPAGGEPDRIVGQQEAA